MFLSKIRLTLILTLWLCATSVSAQSTSKKVIFADQIGRLLMVNADGSGQTFLTPGGSNLDRHPVFSPDGSKVAFDRNTLGKTNIYVMNADGSTPVAITSNDAFPEASINEDPTWSPDGSKIAFVSDRGGRFKKEIWVMNADGSGLVKLTTNVQIPASSPPVYRWDTDPSWSPDGSSIAFSSARDNALSQIYLMNTDGSNQTRIVTANHDHFPTWSPNSLTIAFSSDPASPRKGINIVNRNGTNEVNVTNNGAYPAWAPDGTRLAFMRIDGTNFDSKFAIFLIDIDGGNPRKITNHPFDCLDPSWAPVTSPPIPTSTISGHVVDGSGAPISGANLTLSGTLLGNTQSDASGAYSFSGLPAGDYRIAISKPGFGFNPPFIELSNVTTNQPADFTGFVAYTISGQFNGALFTSIQVNLTGSQTRTVESDVNGRYFFDYVPAGGTYTVTPVSPFYIMSPTSVTFNNLSANQVANFDQVPARYTISGRTTRLGNSFPGVTVTLNVGFTNVTTISDANGNYSFPNLTAGLTYRLSAFKSGNYFFFPPNIQFDRLGENKTADFVGNSANNLLLDTSGFRFGEGPCVVVLTVFRGGNAAGVGPITVDYATSDVTATAGEDYTATAGTLDFPEGTYSRTIRIPILDDAVVEGDETFSLTLSNPTGEVDLVAPSRATFTIADTDTLSTVSLPTEPGSDRALALNATTWLTAPFKLTTTPNFSFDERTRIALFVENLNHSPCSFLSSFIVEAEDAQQNHFGIEVESIYKLPGVHPYTQLILLLPQNRGPGDLLVAIKINSVVSNKVRVSIIP